MTPMAKARTLRLSAIAVVIAILVAGVWLTRLLPAPPILDPHGSGPSTLFVLSYALMLIAPLISATGLVVLMLTSATRLEKDYAASLPPTGKATDIDAAGAPRTMWSRRLAWEAPPALMTTIATAIVAAWALSFMITPIFGWSALPGAAVLAELVDFLGLSSQVGTWVFPVTSLLINLTIAIFLFVGEKPQRRPLSDSHGSNGGRR